MSAPESLQQLFLEVSRNNASRTAILHPEGGGVTYASLAQGVAAVAASIETAGVRPGGRVAILLPNSLAFVMAYFGAVAAGAVVVPLNAMYQKNELLRFLKVCNVEVLVSNAAHEQLCREVLRCDNLPVQLELIEDTPAAPARPIELAGVMRSPAEGAPLMIQFSSGSTGAPKQIARTHGNLLFELASLQRTLALTCEDRFLGVAPFSHVNGLTRSMLASLTCGAALCPLPRFERQVLSDAITGHRLTVFIGVPFHFAMLGRTRFREEPDFSSLRLCVSASAPLPRSVAGQFHQRFGHWVRQLYGSTETGTISVNVEADPGPHVATAGTPLPGVEVEVFSDSGAVAGVGELGEFAVKSPAAIRGYVDAEEANRESFRDGWFLTGDLGTRDGSGLLTLAGRKKFFINKGGYKIDPREIEELLESHPAVEEAVVIGVPTSYGDEKVTTVIVASAPLNAKEVIDFCEGKIAAFKVPSVIEFRDSIPKSPTGKIRRAMLYPAQR